MKSRSVAVVAYVPAPHAGYLKLFRAYEGSVLYVLGEEFIKEFPSLVRHLPGTAPEEAQMMVKALGIFSNVRILTKSTLEEARQYRIIMPDEDVSRTLDERYFKGSEVIFDGRWRLRWDWGATMKAHRPEGEHSVSYEEFDREFIRAALKVAKRSPDWWRQIGAWLVDENWATLLVAINQHVPYEQSAYLMGDPRSNFEAGQYIELSNAAHAEAVLIATAANRGLSMSGCSLYVSTFPCPPCANLCSFTGIRRLYYADGYALVAGAETLRARDVQIIRVDMTPSPSG